MRMPPVVLCGFSRASPSASYDNGGWNTVQVNWKRFSTESYLITSIGGMGGEVLSSEFWVLSWKTGRRGKFWVLSYEFWVGRRGGGGSSESLGSYEFWVVSYKFWVSRKRRWGDSEECGIWNVKWGMDRLGEMWNLKWGMRNGSTRKNVEFEMWNEEWID